MSLLGTVSREGFVVEFTGAFWVEAEVELIFPTEFKPGLAECVVAVLGAAAPNTATTHSARPGLNSVGKINSTSASTQNAPVNSTTKPSRLTVPSRLIFVACAAPTSAQ